jgi:hypothetical protein
MATRASICCCTTQLRPTEGTVPSFQLQIVGGSSSGPQACHKIMLDKGTPQRGLSENGESQKLSQMSMFRSRSSARMRSSHVCIGTKACPKSKVYAAWRLPIVKVSFWQNQAELDKPISCSIFEASRDGGSAKGTSCHRCTVALSHTPIAHQYSSPARLSASAYRPEIV